MKARFFLIIAVLFLYGCKQEIIPYEKKIKSAYPFLELKKSDLNYYDAGVDQAHRATLSATSSNHLNSILLGEDCSSLNIPPQKDLIFSHVYARDDRTASNIDKSAKKIYQEQTKPIRRFEAIISEMANTALFAPYEEGKAVARCVLFWMDDWASEGAYLGNVNSQGRYVRQWALAVLSTSYDQIQIFLDNIEEEKNANGKFTKQKIISQRRNVEKWLSSIANENIITFKENPDKQSNNNNHLYWAAWGILNTGVALDNKFYYQWGINAIIYMLDGQLDENYLLPQESKRGKKALQYHNFSATPVVLIAETAINNELNLYGKNNERLLKFLNNLFRGIKNPDIFTNLIGVKQDSLVNIDYGHYAWLEIYYKRLGHDSITEFLSPRRPIISKRAGGNISLLFRANKKLDSDSLKKD